MLGVQAGSSGTKQKDRKPVKAVPTTIILSFETRHFLVLKRWRLRGRQPTFLLTVVWRLCQWR